MKLYQDRSSGFTLVEALAATAILIILLGLSAVGVARWRDPLKITELDNAARAIYMAAENRAVLLQNSGASFSLLADSPGEGITASEVSVTQDGTEQTVSLCVLSDAARADILDELLPAGVIDPSLRDGHFYILYDKNTCHVFEVFYAEEKFDKTELNALRGRNRSQRVSYYRGDTANRCLVGYYEGGLAGQIGTKPLPTPGVEVLIENGSELRLTVRYTIPAQLTGADVKRVPTVTLEYKGEKVKLLFVNDVTKNVVSPYSERLTKDQDITSNTKPMSAEYIWTLDSLEQDGGGNFTKRFKDLFNNPDSIAFGGDFTVTASLRLSADGYLSSSSSARATDNSLFDTTSTGDTAKVANLRHLQNLDSDSSGAAGKKTAVQCADIDCSKYIGNNGNELVSNYEFKPIQNNDLTAYDARHDEAGAAALPYSISNLTVTANSADKKNGAGLFGSGGKVKFQSICLDKPNVTAGKNAKGEAHSAGALMGYCWGPATFDSCQVINATVNGSDGASYVGGIVGHVNQSKFIGCTVKGNTVINGSNYAGGLAGLVDWIGSDFEKCQVINARVKTPGVAGGMAGSTWSGTVSFTECIAEGITVTSTGSYAGGLMGWIGNSVGKVEFAFCDIGTNGTDITVSGTQAGGILGNADGNATFSKCTVGKLDSVATIAIFGTQYAGGLVGDSLFGSIFTLTGCGIFNAQVTGTNWNSTAGGMVGAAEGTATTITNSKSCNVTVSAGSYAGGLVGSATRGKFTDCEAANTTVDASAWNGEVGGLIGRLQLFSYDLTSDATFDDAVISGCWVYWDKSTGSGNFPTGKNDYKVTALSTAGGLVGAIRNGAKIEESFAATLVKGRDYYAGGLVGNYAMLTTFTKIIDGEEKTLTLPDDKAALEVAITNSYADCCIYTKGTAGGLIGMREKRDEPPLNLKLTLTNVYATGFIDMTDGGYTAGGVHGGYAVDGITATNVYTAMHYDVTDTVTVYPLAAGLAWSQGDNCYWWKYDGLKCFDVHDNPDNWWVSRQDRTYAEMSSLVMGTAFQKPASSTVPYNLDGGSRATYPFPGLVGLPHYGDWPIS